MPINPAFSRNYKPPAFSRWSLTESLGLGLGPGERYFLHNPILGNLSPKRWFGVEVGRVAGFMFEPGLIAFFFGFNILVASDWIKNQRVARRFVWLNYMAGFATISVAFILIMGALLFGKRLIGLIRMEFVSVISILLGILLILFLSSQNITEMTSLDARLSGFYQILTIIENNTLLTFLFGNGVGVSKELFDSGIDSGWMGVFVERGMVMLIFMIFLLVNFTRGNVWLMLYIMFYSLSINMFWSPVALLGIALNYALFFHIRKSHFASWPLAARPLTRTDAGSAVERRF